MSLSLATTIGIYSGIGLLGGFTIDRPIYGISYGITSAVMTVAFRALFGPTGYYLMTKTQVITFIAKIGEFLEERS